MEVKTFSQFRIRLESNFSKNHNKSLNSMALFYNPLGFVCTMKACNHFSIFLFLFPQILNTFYAFAQKYAEKRKEKHELKIALNNKQTQCFFVREKKEAKVENVHHHSLFVSFAKQKYLV